MFFKILGVFNSPGGMFDVEQVFSCENLEKLLSLVIPWSEQWIKLTKDPCLQSISAVKIFTYHIEEIANDGFIGSREGGAVFEWVDSVNSVKLKEDIEIAKATFELARDSKEDQ